MIESTYNRTLITEDIERWAKYTKIKQYLRVGDIPNIVNTIIDEFYHVTLSCCHKVRSIDEGIDIEFEDVCCDADGIGECMITMSVCKDCLKDYETFPKFRIITKVSSVKENNNG